MDSAFALLDLLRHELLLFGAVFLLIGGIDDALVDLIWLFRWAYRRMTFYRSRPPLRAHELPPAIRPGLIAIFVPAWREAAVIGEMLDRCKASWNQGSVDYRIYVGAYPNDNDSIAAVMHAASGHPQVRLVLVPHDGPTTKADCLNQLWREMVAEELSLGQKVKAIILHDAEDSVHRDELRIIDSLIEKHIAVQLPVIPLRTRSSKWISGHYCDEFAEAHGKSMVVREAVGAALPLAGVGCAIDRNILGRIALQHGNQPFDSETLTEDYELGIRLGASGQKTIMARILDDRGQLVGTRAYFPETLHAAVKQKSRWLTGIALAGWDRLGWDGSIAERWMRLRDRRSILAALVLLAAYACIILTAIITIAQVGGSYSPRPIGPALKLLLIANLGFMIWRILIRMAFVGHQYGPVEALLSVPRGAIANLISIMAARRACAAYLRHIFGKPLRWESTEHHMVPPTGTIR